MQSRIHFRNLSQLRRAFPDEPELWAVDLRRQRVHRLAPNGVSTAEPVSTSRYGLGDAPGSNRTPLGAHRVRDVIGTGAPPGQRFVDRKAVGKPLTEWRNGVDDAILTRILRLDGLVPGLNQHSYGRYIYLHGTNQEEKLGTPASHGCVRMGNRAIAEWADALGDRRPLVWIGTLEEVY